MLTNNNSILFKHKCIATFLKQNGADAFFVVSKQNRLWLTCIDCSDGFCIVTKNKIYFLVDKRDFDYCKTSLNSNITLVEYKNLESIKQIFKKDNIKTIVVEDDYLTFKQFYDIVELLQVETFGIDSKTLRMVKTSEEVTLLQQSADITCKVMNDVRKFIKVGMSELEVKKFIFLQMIKYGASDLSFDSIVCFGKNTANPHHQAGNKKLANNELVTIDVGCIYKGYCSDCTRSFFVGNKPTKQQKHIYDLVFKAQKLGLEKAKTGMPAKELDAIVRNFISKDKIYGKLFVHSLGHGVGIDIHELPNVSSKSEFTLVKNNVITIEPGVYKPNFGGVRIEDTIMLTDKGIINLTAKAIKRFEK